MTIIQQILGEEKVEEVFSKEEAKAIGDQLGVDWEAVDPDEFHLGMNIELEHGTKNPEVNITDDDPVKTAKITLAHLKEDKKYNSRLKKMEKGAHPPKTPLLGEPDQPVVVLMVGA